MKKGRRCGKDDLKYGSARNFDGNKAGYAIELLPTGELASENIRFALPKWGNGRPDNFVSHKQKISVNAGHVREFHILYAGDWIDGENGAEFEFEFQNGGRQVVQCTSLFTKRWVAYIQLTFQKVSVKNWWDLHWLNNGAIQTPYHNTPDGRNYNITQVHHWSSTVSSVSPLKSIRFPPRSNLNRLHVFALSLVPAYAHDSHSGSPSPAVSVKNVRLTTLKTDEGNSIVEVTLANLRALATSDCYAFASENASTRPCPHQVIIRPIDGQIGLRTVTPGKVFRLMPGDDARVDTNSPTTRATGWELDLGMWIRLKQDSNFWEPTVASLSRHETPAGLGGLAYIRKEPPNALSMLFYDRFPRDIMKSGTTQPSNELWNHHRDTYGESKLYDDFIPEFTGAKFNASRWINLFNPDAAHTDLETGQAISRQIMVGLSGLDICGTLDGLQWCDIGGPNRTLEFAAEWYNQATKAGKQVTMNNRCGVVPDFDTPEYARFSSIQTHSWETSEGIDPYSYGYNRQTKDEEYRSAETIIQSLVDIVSKNGNYLLNLGPTGEGEIIPAMVERLVEVGEWLGHSGECVFNTTYSFLGAESNSIRFTTTPKSFCIISLSEPEGDRLVVERPVPILPGDTITFLGDKK
ncbi:Alpha-L-fucosidase [Rhizoctonia solani]|uniref:alpha-L-fucosidase n=1 Tax=Rhizoctonia solani TaxID=456999 RepID=A0A8H7IB03_9AGAM|nr:Alpha-L-fucosidase [Rhizoctonia solani]